MPVCGGRFLHYGGSTTCFSMQTDTGWIIFDAGTGIGHVARDLARLDEMPAITLLFTHFHLDHVVGLPCFDPLYSKRTEISIMADPRRSSDWRDTLYDFMAKPYWPVGLGEADANMRLADLPIEDQTMELHGVRISWFRVPHPQQCLAYRVEMPGNTVVIATDVEYEAGAVNPAFIEFCAHADFLIYDTQYAPDEYPAHRGWGHSTWETAARIAAESRADRLIMTHHDPDRDDAGVRGLVDDARKIFPNTEGATENMLLETK